MNPGATSARIRPATVDDADAVAAVHRRVWAETYGDRSTAHPDRAPWEAAAWRELLAHPGGTQTWVATRAGEVVGFATAEAEGPRPVRPLQLRLLGVPAAEQGRRTGSHLVELAIGDAPCYVWVGAGASRTQRFFTRHGFRADGGRRAVDGPGEEIRMVR